MPGPMGGRRDRLIHENVFRLVRDSLNDLGWGDAGRAHRPLSVRITGVGPQEEVPLNTLVVSAEDTSGEGIELGSFASEDTRPFYVDFYAENDVIGAHCIGDVREILRGKLAGRVAPVLDVYDYDVDPPELLFSCLIDEVTTDRAHEYSRPHEAHWYSCAFIVLDEVD